MCTVTYLPKSNQHFILTHNRDEHHTRGLAFFPKKEIIHKSEVLIPTDVNAGGTWIATSKEYTLCLLNGGATKHISTPPYRHSRGFIILDFFKYNNTNHFFDQYNINQIEPFTLIIVAHEPRALYQIVSDGTTWQMSTLDDHENHIWSSTTLYSDEERQIRNEYFKSFIEKNEWSKKAIIAFHTNKYKSEAETLIQINKQNILKTVSLTSILNEGNISMTYLDFNQDKESYLEL